MDKKLIIVLVSIFAALVIQILFLMAYYTLGYKEGMDKCRAECAEQMTEEEESDNAFTPTNYYYAR